MAEGGRCQSPWPGDGWVQVRRLRGAWVGDAWVGDAWIGAAWVGVAWIGVAWIGAALVGAVSAFLYHSKPHGAGMEIHDFMYLRIEVGGPMAQGSALRGRHDIAWCRIARAWRLHGILY